MKRLAGGGFVLEPQTAAHAPALFAVLQDPAIYRYEHEAPAALPAFTQRLQRLESRRSPDGKEEWLNWVVRVDDGDLAGYVQATVHPSGDAWVAYVLASRFWGRGLASHAVARMLPELAATYGVHTAWATFKQANARSRRLLERLSFTPAGPGPPREPDEDVYVRRLASAASRTPAPVDDVAG